VPKAPEILRVFRANSLRGRTGNFSDLSGKKFEGSGYLGRGIRENLESAEFRRRSGRSICKRTGDVKRPAAVRRPVRCPSTGSHCLTVIGPPWRRGLPSAAKQEPLAVVLFISRGSWRADPIAMVTCSTRAGSRNLRISSSPIAVDQARPDILVSEHRRPCDGGVNLGAQLQQLSRFVAGSRLRRFKSGTRNQPTVHRLRSNLNPSPAPSKTPGICYPHVHA